MNQRLRMYRKRLMVARERDRISVERAIWKTIKDPMKLKTEARSVKLAWDRVVRRHEILRAIERRKEGR